MLALESASYSVHGRCIVDELSLAVKPGRLLALIGPNGAGKSTALGLLSGRLDATRGEATLDGEPLADWEPEVLAQRRAVLSQNVQLAFGFTAREVVLLGRSSRCHRIAVRDERIANAALEATCAAHLARRNYLELSGGEQQRVQLARVLAQIWERGDVPAYLLLDEPEAGLDIAHQHFILRFARRLAHDGYGVVAVLHDLNLAARHADEIAVLSGGRLCACGVAEQALEPQRLSSVYGIELCRMVDAAGTSLIVPRAVH
ncbi:heme ABC transporter ATP-binding protein [Solimonas marina]|uniref:Heme ABC transporter ATP-binding protein n=1 Tax=Solimonas marina TaxID=2714601 RepID=A0A969W9G9_9GAMM|nr:heme ABC transporter ATP-binding protein [Solimonas marina]NKF22364.1 heme ABC transporter ATP-binding protein [Solimonas marina]